MIALLIVALSRVVFPFADPAIDESSGLVDLGSTMVTVNDSGGDPVLYVLDSRTGRTVGRTTFADSVVDTEALAPGGEDVVWVGDIGDNRGVRDHVTVYRVPVRPGDRTVAAPAYRLVYPNGAQDAESMVVHDGRVYLISKAILGGRMYVAPRHLRADRVNRLREVGPVGLWATDAALFPGGRHLLVRGYGNAAVLEFPSLKPVGMFGLPEQEQGEGVSIGPDGRIRLSSEGVGAPVLQIELPKAFADAMAPASASPSPESADSPEKTGSAPALEPVSSGPAGWPLWAAASIAVASAGILVVITGRALGRRVGRRRR